MSAVHTLFASIFGLGLVCGVTMAVANKLVAGMIDDELRTRLDKLAGVFVSLALRRLPADQREFYQPDWEGVLLANLYDETAGLPVTRVFKAAKLGLDLWLGAGGVRRETKLAKKTQEIKVHAFAEMTDYRNMKLLRAIQTGSRFQTTNLDSVVETLLVAEGIPSAEIVAKPRIYADAVVRADQVVAYIDLKHHRRQPDR